VPATISICARRDKSAGAPHFFAALTSFPEVHFDRDQDQGRKAANRRKRRSTSPRGIAIFAQPMPSSGRREVRQTSGPANHSGRARAADADLSNSLQNKQFPSNRRRPRFGASRLRAPSCHRLRSGEPARYFGGNASDRTASRWSGCGSVSSTDLVIRRLIDRWLSSRTPGPGAVVLDSPGIPQSSHGTWRKQVSPPAPVGSCTMRCVRRTAGCRAWRHRAQSSRPQGRR